MKSTFCFHISPEIVSDELYDKANLAKDELIYLEVEYHADKYDHNVYIDKAKAYRPDDSFIMELNDQDIESIYEDVLQDSYSLNTKIDEAYERYT